MIGPRIGCLAWGSLLWDPRTLPRAGDFRQDGPMLPIEFSRVSMDGRVTLVIDAQARDVQTYWVPLGVRSEDEAVLALGMREKIAPDLHSRWVGLHTKTRRALHRGETDEAIRGRISAWLETQDLDAVVWTALPSRGPDGASIRPSLNELFAHLESLEGAARDRAEEYIRRTPSLVRTEHRARFEERFGWVPLEEG